MEEGARQRGHVDATNNLAAPQLPFPALLPSCRCHRVTPFAHPCRSTAVATTSNFHASTLHCQLSAHHPSTSIRVDDDDNDSARKSLAKTVSRSARVRSRSVIATRAPPRRHPTSALASPPASDVAKARVQFIPSAVLHPCSPHHHHRHFLLYVQPHCRLDIDISTNHPQKVTAWSHKSTRAATVRISQPRSEPSHSPRADCPHPGFP